MGTPRRLRPPRLIRRYENRKLYDTADGRHVTLDEIGSLVARGCEVEVLDHRSGHDLTGLTLAQVLLEGIKHRTARIPRSVLCRLIRFSARPSPAFGDWSGPDEATARAQTEVERVLGGLMRRGRLSLDEALSLRQEVTGVVHRLVAEAQAGVESRIRHLLERGDGSAGISLTVLRDRLDALDRHLGRHPAQPRRASAATRKGPLVTTERSKAPWPPQGDERPSAARGGERRAPFRGRARPPATRGPASRGRGRTRVGR